jgi:SAM-dependent methyltransferase
MLKGRFATWYSREVLSRVLDHGMRGVEPLRDALLACAHGRVLEIGFGTGANLPHLPAAVTSLVAVEPSEGLAARARARLARWDRPHEVLVQPGGEPLPYPDASFDVAVITFVLCSVRQAAPLLAQTRRLLKPGAPLLLAEHIVARPAPLRALQTALRPAWKACLGGCDPTSDPRTALVDAGFDIAGLEERPLDMFFVVRPGLIGVALAR